MKNQKTKGNDTKQNIPFVTKKYQQRAMGHCRTKEEKNEILLYKDKDSEAHLSWALKEAKDCDRWRQNGNETNSDKDSDKGLGSKKYEKSKDQGVIWSPT